MLAISAESVHIVYVEQSLPKFRVTINKSFVSATDVYIRKHNKNHITLLYYTVYKVFLVYR